MLKQELAALLEHIEIFSRLPVALARTRELLFDLTTQGQVLPQVSDDGTGAEALEQMALDSIEQADTVRRKTATFLPVDTDDVPFPIPESWAWVRLGEAAKFIDYRGRTPVKTTSGVRLVTAKNVRMGHVREEPAEFIAENAYTGWMTRGLPRPNDVLFTTEAPLANVALFEFTEPIALAQRIICLAPYKGLSGPYLAALLRAPSMQAMILDRATGTTVSGIRSAQLKQIPIPVPPMAEQDRIADFLTRSSDLFATLDEALVVEEAERRQLALTAFLRIVDSKDHFAVEHMHELVRTAKDVDDLERAVLGLAVSGQLVPQLPEDGSAHDLIESFELQIESKKGRTVDAATSPNPPFDIPEQWAWSTLGVAGTVVGGGTPRSGKDDAFAMNPNEGIDWYTPADLGGSRAMYARAPRRWLSDVGLKSSSAQLLPTGAVLFSSRAPIGYVAILNEAAATNQGFKSLVPREGLLSEFVYFWLRYRAPAIDAAAPSTTFREVNKKSMEREPIPVPPTAEQQRIIDRVLEMLARINHLREIIAT